MEVTFNFKISPLLPLSIDLLLSEHKHILDFTRDTSSDTVSFSLTSRIYSSLSREAQPTWNTACGRNTGNEQYVLMG